MLKEREKITHKGDALRDLKAVGGEAILCFIADRICGVTLIGPCSRPVLFCRLSFPEVSALESLHRSLVYSR